jgi:hypothetical protein
MKSCSHCGGKLCEIKGGYLACSKCHMIDDDAAYPINNSPNLLLLPYAMGMIFFGMLCMCIITKIDEKYTAILTSITTDNINIYSQIYRNSVEIQKVKLHVKYREKLRKIR